MIGAVLGLVAPGMTWIAVLGKLFVGALKAIAPILVFILVASSLANAKGGNMKKFRTVIFLYMFSTLCAAVVAVLVNFIHPVTLRLTALNSSGDVIFTATAEFLEWEKQGKELPL